jgi:23S rRNA (guanosine2251-2'-O)-methyltransferase
VSPNRLSLGAGQQDHARDQRPPRPEGPRQPGGNHGGNQAFQKRHDGPRNDQRPRHQDGPRPGPDTPRGAVWLYGHHAVAAALANPQRRLRRLILTVEAEASLAQTMPPPWPLAPERTDRSRIDQLLGRDIAHQGAALLADPLAQPSLASVLERRGPIVVLDQVTDPRNIGAIMRSAAAFGAAAVITQDRNAPEETGSLAKAASGALETMPLLRAVNIARTLIALKAANVWCVGLDASGKPLSGPFFAGRRVALVLGAEGEGMRRLTKETCDEIAGLSTKGAVESLNVSAAGAVALYELTRQA